MTSEEKMDYLSIREDIAKFVGAEKWSLHDQALLQEKLDIFAHELAEKIRREGGYRLCFNGCKDLDANLIDPEMQ